ncbi:ATP-binding protein [Citricoccus nitrophenolicus]|uniref:sensor histidine kinase n=1 Tax=Citricoccus nitrophenolicus TaxID=863575 RepID=UPI0039B37689
MSTNRAPAPRLRFAGQIMALQVAVVLLVVLVTGGVTWWLSYRQLGAESELRALTVARAVASDDEVQAEVAKYVDRDVEQIPPEDLLRNPLVSLAADVESSTGALFVVITDDEGIRLTHPNPKMIGHLTSTHPTAALTGREVANRERGTLGLSVRAKVPVFAPGSTTEVVGQVSLGYAMEEVLDNLHQDMIAVGVTAGGAMALGVLGSWLLGRRLRRLTLGLEPEEIAALTQDQEAVLRGVDEGVIGVSAQGRITVINDEARTLLGLEGEDLVGRPLREVGAPASLLRAVEEAGDEHDSREEVIGSRVVILTARPVLRGGSQDLGTVIMLRDRTQMQALTRQLQTVSSMTTALRAQRHEFANRLHTISGLLSIGEHLQAEEYVGDLLDSGPMRFPLERVGQLREPYLQAFLGAKAVEAAERGVHLRLGSETMVRGRVSEPNDVTAVLGNLVDNAVHAAVRGSDPDRWVEVDLLDEGGDGGPAGVLHVAVADSGDGTTDADRIFTEGFTTSTADIREAHGQGLGLSLCRRIARERSGDVWLAQPGRPGGPGAVFCARLPGTVVGAVDDAGRRDT